MRTIFCITLALLAVNVFGQTNSANCKPIRTDSKMEVKGDSIPHGIGDDTSIKVVYSNNNKSKRESAYYINDLFVGSLIIQALDPSMIKDIKVVKGIVEISNVKYDGKVLVNIKTCYTPKLISLNGLKAKYTNLKKGFTLFFIDNNMVDADCNNYFVDEKCILRIIVDKVDSSDGKLEFDIVRLVTRTEENIRKSKEIRIRGMEDLVKNE